MSIKAFSCVFLIAVTAHSAIMPVATSAAEKESQPPNILILYADDLGFGDLGIQNLKSKIPTPHLDQLARTGMRFSDGHSSSGICTPSRYALLTGRYHWRDFHDIVGAMGPSRFPSERLTLPEMLQQKCYRTACIGKWHLGWDWNAIRKPDAKQRVGANGKPTAFGPEAYDWNRSIPDGPLAHGFDYYFGDTVINFPPYGWIENDKLVTAPDSMLDTSKWKPIKEGNWECRPGPMCSDWDPYQVLPTLATKGVEYIHAQANSDRPFFLYFAFPCPHAPIIPNDEWDGKSAAGPFGDFVCEMDDVCGQLLAALDQSGQADNTIVFFSADNGPEHYAYARDKNFDHWSAAPFRGLKRDIYEGGHHVPFVIRWPGVTKPQTVSDALVSQIDIYATLADALKIELPVDAAEDSLSLLPLLRGEVGSVRASHVHNTYPKKFAMRSGEWLLIDAENGYQNRVNLAWETKHGYPADNKQSVELYNLKRDIGQRHDLAAEYPDKITELQKMLKQIKDEPNASKRQQK